MKLNKRDILNLLIVFGIAVALVLVCKLGFGTFVIKGDYLFQHGVIPDAFRYEFYHTGKLLPDSIFQLGAGTNIYNFSYYGLLSPVILISYLFPGLKMMTFMQLASAVLFACTGLFMYIWMRRNYSENESLISAIMILLVPPMLFGFQNQIVFVECVPFVILSLIAVDRKVEYGHNAMLIVSMALMIFVNYYSSITSLICVMTYYGYRYLMAGNKVSVKAVWSIIRPVVISVMLAGVLLIPTAYVILNGVRMSNHSYKLIDLFIIPAYNDMYRPNSMGITMFFVFTAIAVLVSSRHIIAEKFVTIVLLLLTFHPFVLYLLNGGNYIRNKAAIPLWPLWCMLFIIMYRKMKDKKLNYRVSVTIFSMVCIAMYLLKWYREGFVIDIIFTLLVIVVCRWTRRRWICAVCMIVAVAGVSSGLEMYFEHTVHFADDRKIEKITDEILDEDREIYRIGNNVRQVFNTNKIYSEDYMTTSIYTSTHNKYYWKFYSKYFGNNIYYRNYLMLGGSHNPLFKTFMGEKYLLDDYDLDDADYTFQPQYSTDMVNVYKNDNAFPLVYGKRETIKMKDFNKLSFPYSMDCLMNYAVIDYVDNDAENESYDLDANEENLKEIADESGYDDGGRIRPYAQEMTQDQYQMNLTSNSEYTIDLKEPVREKYLIIQFKVRQEASQDLKICINDNRNLLTQGYAEYNNRNNVFKYVISAKDELKQLKIFVQAGKYDISNVRLYTYDFDPAEVKMDKGVITKMDHKNSTITAELTAEVDEYMITSFPYDEGYTIYVDGKKVEKEIVNTSFLGCKISKGSHTVKMVYRSPWKKAGMGCSAIGVLLLFIDIVMDIKRRRYGKVHNGIRPGNDELPNDFV